MISNCKLLVISVRFLENTIRSEREEQMFETAELNQRISNSDFKKLVPKLREQLVILQEILRKGQYFQTILLFSGVDGAGKGETVSLLNEWMDPRWLITRAYDDIEEARLGRPEYWKFWRDLPPRGRIGMFLSAWYSKPVLDYAYGKIDDNIFHSKLERIVQFERTLAQDGALILKFWMHLSNERQEERLKSLENDPLTKARVTARDWKHWKMYDNFIDTAEQVISRTNRGSAHWNIIEGADPNFRSISVANVLHNALHQRLEQHIKLPSSSKPSKKSKFETKSSLPNAEVLNNALTSDFKLPETSSHTVLDRLDMTQTIEKKIYNKKLVELQAKLHSLHIKAKAEKIASILVFEGPDAAGKGGAIRRITNALDPRNYQVHGFAAPTDEEKAQNHLWRFWRRLPQEGHICIFDRSWYGRVLVERIEKFASEEEWKRAYAEINEFESQLTEHGIVLVKYWVHITKKEQLNRFKLREETPHKRWKLTDEDWRNREKWNDYEQAVNDMVQYTSTTDCPWTLIEGNDKRFARIKALENYCNQLESQLKKKND